MKVVDPYVAVPGINGVQLLRNIEEAGRVCYKSEDAITGESYYPFIEKILKLGHESIFEHEKVTARIVCDRGVSHEIVRHRLAAYSMESSRYCNYSKGKFGGNYGYKAVLLPGRQQGIHGMVQRLQGRRR